MSRIKEWWLRKSRKWKLVIIIVPVAVILGVGGLFGTVQYFKNPQSCVTCHILEPYLGSYQNADFLDYAHAQAEEAVACKDCHTETLFEVAGELVTYVMGNYEYPFPERRFSGEMCLSCHPNEEIIEATADLPENPHDSHFPGTECRICHKVHRKSENYCASAGCHTVEFLVPYE
jgi:hypothetical protein